MTALLIALVNYTLSNNREQMKAMNDKLNSLDHKLIRMVMIIGICHPEFKESMKSQSPIELQMDPEYRTMLKKYIQEGIENGRLL
jgi:hypothetical protein